MASGLVTNSYKGRYYIFTWDTKSQSMEQNSSTITWSVTAYNESGGNGYVGEKEFLVTINGKTVFEKTSRVERRPGVVASGETTIVHDSDGTKTFTVYLGAAVYKYGAYNVTATGQFPLEYIPKEARILTATDFTDEENPTITYSNSAGSDVTTLQACISLDSGTDTVRYRDIPKNGTKYQFELSDVERNTLRGAVTGSNSRAVYFRIKTVLNGKEYVNSAKRTFSIANGQPTITGSVIDINTSAVALTGDSSTLVRYVSNAYAEMSVEPKKGATISEKTISCGARSRSGDSTTFNSVESSVFTFYARDNRGNVSTQTIKSKFVEYVKPTCAITSAELDGTGHGKLVVEGACFWDSFGEKTNEITVLCRCKSESDSFGDWTQATVRKSGSRYIAEITFEGLDYRNKCTFQAKVSDLVTSDITSGEQTVKAFPVFDWGEDDFNFNVPVNVNGAVKAEQVTTSNGVDLDEFYESEAVKISDYGYAESSDGSGVGSALSLSNKTSLVYVTDPKNPLYYWFGVYGVVAGQSYILNVISSNGLTAVANVHGTIAVSGGSGVYQYYNLIPFPLKNQPSITADWG